jgi:hypothetical protein
MDDVYCQGYESRLFDCQHTQYHNCADWEGVGLTCHGESPAAASSSSGSEDGEEGGLRINDGQIEGRLEIFSNGAWHAVCDDGFSMTNAEVACRQLGFEGPGASYYTTDAGGLDFRMDDVYCTGSEERFVDCQHTQYHNCGNSEGVGLRCSLGQGHDTTTDYGNASYGNWSEPHGNWSEPWGNWSEPHGNWSEPHGNWSEPHGNWSEPHGNWSEPHGNWSEPHGNWSEPWGNWSEPDGNWSEPSGNWSEPTMPGGPVSLEPISPGQINIGGASLCTAPPGEKCYLMENNMWQPEDLPPYIECLKGCCQDFDSTRIFDGITCQMILNDFGFTCDMELPGDMSHIPAGTSVRDVCGATCGCTPP